MHVGQASHVASLIEDMEGLEADLYDLKQQNNALRLQIADHERMSELKERALAMGFVEPESIEYVVVVVDELHSSPGDGRGADVRRAGGGSPASLPLSWHGVLQQFTNWMGLAQPPSPH